MVVIFFAIINLSYWGCQQHVSPCVKKHYNSYRLVNLGDCLFRPRQILLKKALNYPLYFEAKYKKGLRVFICVVRLMCI